MLIVTGTLRSIVLRKLRECPRWWPTVYELAMSIMSNGRAPPPEMMADFRELERAIYRELDLLQTAGLVEVHDAAAGTMNAWSAKC